MRLAKAWIVAAKDLKTFKRKKNILYSTIIIPLAMSILLPLVIEYGRGISASELPGLLNTFSFWFIVLATIIPSAIASYAIVGEKLERSLEPLLATPTTDGEILLGKTIAAFLPPLLAIYAGASIFMALVDYVTFDRLGHFYFPNLSIGVVLLLVVPLAVILCIQFNVIVSSKVNDVRAAQQTGIFAVLPLLGIQMASLMGFFTLDIYDFLIISAIFLAFDFVLFYISTSKFQREEILTKWT